MATFFVAEVGIMLWILFEASLCSNGRLLAFMEILITTNSDLHCRNIRRALDRYNE